MSDPFQEEMEGLKQTAEGIIAANAGLVIAGEGLKRAITAMQHTKGEFHDLRETVERLEQLVMQQTREIQALRERLNGGAS